MRKLTHNFIFNVAGMAAPILIALVTVPLYISEIGAARYGVLSIVWLLLGYFGFMDLGLSRASVNALAKLRSSSAASRVKVLATAVNLNLCLGAVGGVILYFAGGFLLEHMLDTPADLRSEIAHSMPWIAALLPLALVSGVAVGALEAQDRFLTANLLQVGGGAVGQIAPIICAALISPSLAVVIPAAVVSRGASVLLTLGFVLYEERSVSLRGFDRKWARELLGYGGWVSISAVINPLLMSLDQLVIGSTLGVAAVAHYAVPMNLVMRSQILATALSRTLFPQWSRALPDEAHALAGKALVSLAYGYAAICAPAVLLVSHFVVAWMGRDFAAAAAPVAELLLIGAWINGLAYIPAVFLQGRGRPDVVAKFHALELAPFIGVLWLLTTEFGLIGAAAAWVLRVAVDAVLLLAAARFNKATLVALLAPLALICASYALVQIWPFSIGEALAAAAIFAAATIISAMAYDRELQTFVMSLSAVRRLCGIRR